MMDNQTLKQALKVGMLPHDFVRLKKRILNEAVRLARDPYLMDYKSQNVWHVIPVIYEVRKENGEWICNCKRFSQLGFCSHSLAVDIREGEGST